MMQASEQQPLQQQQQQQLILQNSSGSLSLSSNISLSREVEEMLRSALSTFRAKEGEIERKKMEVRDRILSHLGWVKEETEHFSTIREQNGSEDDGGEDKVAEEQDMGGGEADEARHRVASSV